MAGLVVVLAVVVGQMRLLAAMEILRPFPHHKVAMEVLRQLLI